MNGLLTPVRAAHVIGVHPNTLANWRVWKRGPKFLKRGGRVFYQEHELKRWMKRT